MSTTKPIHWNPNLPRNGPLAENLSHARHATIVVSSLQKSVQFYSNIMRLELVAWNETSAAFDAKNMLLVLKVGTPTGVFAPNNLIVGHVSVDVPDSKQAFRYLTQEKIPFEINVSVPKGVGKAESEGGSRDNSVGQAFIRDPDGYYLEICDCHILTDFVMGLSDHQLLEGYEEETKTCPNLLWASTMMKMKAQKSRENLSSLWRPDSSSSERTERAKKADPTILNNFIRRRAIYGDICQSFNPQELAQVLCEAGNSAGAATLLMRDRIKSGQVPKVYTPPAYYVGKVDESTKFQPQSLVASGDKQGRQMGQAPIMTAGFLAMDLADPALEEPAEEKKQDDEATDNRNEIADFAISTVNHIAFIVSDVGKSSHFYSEILGLQQVRRPDFDRHGAWFTGGNIEFHLILGLPVAPERAAKSSESNAIWFSVKDLNAAKEKLSHLPATEKEQIQLEMCETEVYLRDPDGYVFGLLGTY